MHESDEDQEDPDNMEEDQFNINNNEDNENSKNQYSNNDDGEENEQKEEDGDENDGITYQHKAVGVSKEGVALNGGKFTTFNWIIDPFRTINLTFVKSFGTFTPSFWNF